MKKYNINLTWEEEAQIYLHCICTRKCNTVEDILEEIILAQVASDGGKGIERFKFFNPHTWYSGYNVKDRHILNAIVGIEELGIFSEVGWFLSPEGQRPIIYFEWEGMQISFHSFNDGLWNLVRKIFHGQVTVWDEKISAETCKKMIKHLLGEIDYFSIMNEQLLKEFEEDLKSGDYFLTKWEKFPSDYCRGNFRLSGCSGPFYIRLLKHYASGAKRWTTIECCISGTDMVACWRYI